MNTDGNQADQALPIPDGAEIYRINEDGIHLAPTTFYDAQPDDLIVLHDGRAGRYLSAGRMRLESSEYAETLRQLLNTPIPPDASPGAD